MAAIFKKPTFYTPPITTQIETTIQNHSRSDDIIAVKFKPPKINLNDTNLERKLSEAMMSMSNCKGVFELTALGRDEEAEAEITAGQKI